MDPDRRPPGGSVVVREAPPSAGGGLRYLGRDEIGRAVWTREADAAELHPTLREANRAALTAPPLPGALRPAYAAPASAVLPSQTPSEPPRPVLRLVAADGVVVGPPPPRTPLPEPASSAPEPPPNWPPNPAAWIWMAWSPWIEAWRTLVFGRRA